MLLGWLNIQDLAYTNPGGNTSQKRTGKKRFSFVCRVLFKVENQ